MILKYTNNRIILLDTRRNIVFEYETTVRVFNLLKTILEKNIYLPVYKWLEKLDKDFKEALDLYNDLKNLGYNSKVTQNIKECIESFKSGKTILECKPYYFEIEISTYCNYNCIYCPRRKIIKKQVNMSLNSFLTIVKKLSEETQTIVFSGMGEPLLNPKIDLFVQAIKNIIGEHVYVVLLTNGYFLNINKFLKLVRAGINEIVISLDTFSLNTYQQIKRVPKSYLYKVIQNLRKISKLKELWEENTKIFLQMILTKLNVGEMKKFIDKTKKMGFDIRLKLLEDWIGKVEIDNIKIGDLKEDSNYSCFIPWKGLYIHVNGNVSYCCYDIAEKYTLGNLLKESLKDIWNNELLIKIREGLTKGKPIGLCKSCKYRKWRLFSE